MERVIKFDGVGFNYRRVNITEVTCKEEGINIIKKSGFFFAKEKLNKDILYSDIKSVVSKNNYNSLFLAIAILCVALGIIEKELSYFVSSVVFVFLSYTKTIQINDIKFYIGLFVNKEREELFEILNSKTNIKCEIQKKCFKKAVFRVCKICIGAFIEFVIIDSFLSEDYLDIVGDQPITYLGQNLNTVEGFTNSYETEWERYENTNNQDIIHASVKVGKEGFELVDLYFIIENEEVVKSDMFIDGMTEDKWLETAIKESMYSSMNPMEEFFVSLGDALYSDMGNYYFGDKADEVEDFSEYNNNEDNQVVDSISSTESNQNNGYLDGYEYELTGEEFKANYSQNTDNLFDSLQECKLDGKTKVKDSKLMNNTIELEWNELHTTEKGTVIEILYTGEDYLSYSITLLFTHDGVVSVTNVEAPGRNLKMTKDDKLNELEIILGK